MRSTGSSAEGWARLAMRSGTYVGEKEARGTSWPKLRPGMTGKPGEGLSTAMGVPCGPIVHQIRGEGAAVELPPLWATSEGFPTYWRKIEDIWMGEASRGLLMAHIWEPARRLAHRLAQ